MTLKRAVAVLAIASLVGSGAMLPRTARASTSDDFMYAGIGLGAYIAVVVVAAALVYRTSAVETSAVPIVESLDREPPAALRFGRGCPQRGGPVNLLCW